VTIESALRLGVIACGISLCLTYGVSLLLLLSGLYENARRRREHASVDYDTIAGSRFAPGVSVIVPAFDEEQTIVSTVNAVLALDYPDFEVIVVNDGSTDRTLAELGRAFDLVPISRAVRPGPTTEPIAAFYRSPSQPTLLVVDKPNGGKADALNAGLNVARHPYVCGLDADTVLAPDALLKTMRVFIADPQTVIGVTSYVDVAADPQALMRAEPGRRRLTTRPLLLAFQTLDFLRIFFGNRLAGSRNRFMMCATGAFQLWRRDVVAEHGGWSRDFTCEDIELTFRLHERLSRQGRPYRIVCLPDRVGATEGPDSVVRLVAQRERWQRVTLETWWAFRGMLFRRRYGRVGLLGMPCFLLTEILGPFFELAAFAIVGIGIARGLVEWDVLVWTAILVAALNALLNAGAILADDRQSRSYTPASLLALSLLAPLELLVYRPITSFARFVGTVRYARGDRRWHSFDRNTRPVAP